MIKKYCRKCEINKPVESFSKNKNSKDGRTLYCKECSKQYQLTPEDKAEIRVKVNVVLAKSQSEEIRDIIEHDRSMRREYGKSAQKGITVEEEFFKKTKLFKGWRATKHGWFTTDELISVKRW